MVRRVLWLMVLIGVLAGLTGAARRYRVEMRNRVVEIAVDFQEVREIAAASRVEVPEVLARLRDAGADSVLLAEDTLETLAEQGAVSAVSDDLSTTISIRDGLVRRRIVDAIPIRAELGAASMQAGDRVRIPHAWSVLGDVGVGISSELVGLIQDSGLRVVGRVGAGRGSDPRSIRLLLGQLASHRVRTVIFTGDVLPGNPVHIGALADILRDPAVDMLVGSVEFGKQRGDSGLTRLAPDRVVRVHAVTAAEMATTTPEENIQRYSLAARERNIRLCFVRLFVDAPDPLESAVRYVSAIRRTLAKAGMGAGAARPFEPLGAPVWVRALCGLAAGSGLLLLVDAFTGAVRRRAWTLILPATTLALAALPAPIGVKLAALIAGCVFPSLGLVVIDLAAPDRMRARELLRRILIPTGVTLIGVVLVVGLLADRVFLVKGDAFAGVKLTLVVPMTVAFVAYVLDLRRGDSADFAPACAQWVRVIRSVWSQPILVGQVVLAVGALAALALMVMRSGNDPGVGVSGLELKLRSLLDRVLMVRPRFKDLIGHPALVFGLGMLMDGRRWIGAALLCLGAVGQASLLNTFCHLHTPLWASAARDAIGFFLGGVVGLALSTVWHRRVGNAA